MMDGYIDLLLSTPLLQNINKMDMEALIKCLKPFLKSYEKGNYIKENIEGKNSMLSFHAGTAKQ